MVVYCAPQIFAADNRYADVFGHYENRQYRYAVMIPEGFHGSQAKPPAPAHGFFIPLADSQDARIDVDAN